jgi:hypothetical protein
MKAVTIHLDEQVYKRFKYEAMEQERTASDLIREAMAVYLEEKVETESHSVLNHPPARSVGGLLDVPETRAELLEDFWDRK